MKISTRVYDDICECARINDIVNNRKIMFNESEGRSVIIVRFNPDKFYHKKKELKIPLSERLANLIETIKEELVKEYDEFRVILIQLYFDDNYTKYQDVKMEDITNEICL